jgi:formiminoglutamate deiminase
MNVWCEQLVVAGTVTPRVRIVGEAGGTVARLEQGVDPSPRDLRLGLVIPGIANAHSHAFHRLLRGRTHDRGGDFWVWRERMYQAARSLEPDVYRAVARAVFAEMLCAGYTAVGEFHYVHHRPDGTPYPHRMELALSAAAAEVGIRLTLLDTVYLAGGIGVPLSPEQRRFGDASASAYLERWHSLAEQIPGLGAALHSARAVPPEAMKEVVAGLPPDVPLHIHVSEQPQENQSVRDAYGVTPVRLLHDLGILSARLSVVHATHLTQEDIGLLGDAGVAVVMCPTTEADLGDGIGPARELLDAGAVLAVGSDQNAVIDPLLEIRGLEMQDRLRSLRRGRFTPAELGRAAGAGGYRALGLPEPLRPGGLFDLVELDTRSARTVGAAPEQILLAATSADVQTVVVGGRVVASSGVLADGLRPQDLLADALREAS